MAEVMVRTLADWGQYFDEDGKSADIIELMNQDDEILDDIKFLEANGEDAHKTTIRNGLPTVVWGRLYKGIPVSKSTVSQVKDAMGFIEGRSEVDARMEKLWGSRFKAYRQSEAATFMESMRQEFATTLFYGDTDTDPDKFMGLAPRYPHKNSPNVVDGQGATAGKQTSMWFIVWGDAEVHAIFPKDSVAGLQHEDLGKYQTLDGDGNKYTVIGDEYRWFCGLSVRDWRCVVRICNIDTTKLELEKGETGFINLHRLTVKAKNKVPKAKRSRGVWYCNEDVLTALELQATDAGNVQLRYGELFDSKEVAFLHGAPVRQCDSILSTEDVLADAA